MSSRELHNVGLHTDWDLGEDGWKAGMDRNLLRLDTLVQARVLGVGENSPPPSPSEGDVYIIGESPTGVWSGYPHHVAVRDADDWAFISPGVEWAMRNIGDGREYRFTGTQWVSAYSTVAYSGEFADLRGIPFTPVEVQHWNTAYSWGDHAAAGYAVAGTGANEHRTNAQNNSRFVGVDNAQEITGTKNLVRTNAGYYFSYLALGSQGAPGRQISIGLKEIASSGDHYPSFSGRTDYVIQHRVGGASNDGSNIGGMVWSYTDSNVPDMAWEERGGVVFGNPDGGFKGNGATNAERVYIDGAEVFEDASGVYTAGSGALSNAVSDMLSSGTPSEIRTSIGAGTAVTGTEASQHRTNEQNDSTFVTFLPDMTALSELDTEALVDGQQFSVEDGDRVRFFKWTSSENEFSELILSPDIVTTGQFGGGVASVQRAIDYAESTGILNVLVTESHDMQGAVLAIPSGMTFKCRTGAVLNNCRVVASGSHGPEVPLTTALSPGDRVFSVSDSSALSVGGYVRIVSAINCCSEDAGRLRLGDRASDNSHFAEFAQIQNINGSEITLADPVLWNYPLAGGGDSANLSQSVLIPVEFNSDISLDVNLTWGETSYPIDFILCKDAVVTGTINSGSSGCVQMQYCYNSHIEGGEYRHTADGSTDAQTIPVKFRSSAGCTLRASAEVFGGHQGFDTTYQVNDSDLYGGPSMFCKCLDSTFRGQTTDAIVTHSGCYATEIAGNTGYCRGGGVRIRSKMDNVHDNFMYGLNDGGTTAYYATDHLLEGSRIRNNFASNFTAVVTQDGAPLYDYSVAVEVRGNTGVGCEFGYRTTAGIGVTALLFGTTVADNTWMKHPSYKEFKRGVSLSRYSNGITVSGNRSFGATEYGVRYDTNTVRLEIVDNKSYDQGPSASGVSGASNLGFILDTDTFPDGESAANLVIRGNITDGSGSEYGAIVRNGDCYRQIAEWGWSNFSQPIAKGFVDNIERSSINIYVDDSVSPRELRARFHDGDSSYDVLLSEYGA